MSTSAVPDLTAQSKNGAGGTCHFLIRRLHSLTGLVFGGYLIVHLLVNATIAQGGGVYQAQVDKIHSLPFLPVIEWTFIYLPILYHTFYGIWITITGVPNNNNYPYAKNWFYLFQRISAVYLVLFMLFHVLAFKYGVIADKLTFDAHGGAMRTVATHMDVSTLITWVVYPLGVLASCYHLANGFWTAAITWGLTVSAGSQRRWGLVCGGLFAITFIAGMISLIAAARLNPADFVAVPVPH